DEDDTRPRLGEREPERGLELLLLPDEDEPLLPLAVGSLDDARVAEAGRGAAGLIDRPADDVARMRYAGLGEPLALPELRGRGDGGGGVEGGGEHRACGDRGGERNGPVDARGDDPVDAPRGGEPVDLRLVLDRDDRPTVGEPEPGRSRVTVDGDDEQPTVAGGFEEAELAGARA